jgi:TRAP-type C4-dicarboxylate transport system permease small subunit
MKYLRENFDECILMCMLSFTTILIFFQVIMRYVFSNSLSWSEELARYVYIWQTWLATSYAVRKERHLRITSLVDLLKGKPRMIIEIVVQAIWLGFTIFLCLKATSLCRMIFTGGQISPALSIPMWIPYASIPVGSAFMSLRLAHEIIKKLKRVSSGEPCA